MAPNQAAAPTLEIGDTVLIEARGREATFADVVDVIAVRTAKPAPGSTLDEVRRLMVEEHIDLMAIFSYPGGPRIQFVFGAIYSRSEWRDLAGQKLVISPVRGHGHG